ALKLGVVEIVMASEKIAQLCLLMLLPLDVLLLQDALKQGFNLAGFFWPHPLAHHVLQLRKSALISRHAAAAELQIATSAPVVSHAPTEDEDVEVHASDGGLLGKRNSTRRSVIGQHRLRAATLLDLGRGVVGASRTAAFAATGDEVAIGGQANPTNRT